MNEHNEHSNVSHTRLRLLTIILALSICHPSKAARAETNKKELSCWPGRNLGRHTLNNYFATSHDKAKSNLELDFEATQRRGRQTRSHLHTACQHQATINKPPGKLQRFWCPITLTTHAAVYKKGGAGSGGTNSSSSSSNKSSSSTSTNH